MLLFLFVLQTALHPITLQITLHTVTRTFLSEYSGFLRISISLVYEPAKFSKYRVAIIETFPSFE